MRWFGRGGEIVKVSNSKSLICNKIDLSNHYSGVAAVYDQYVHIPGKGQAEEKAGTRLSLQE
jgi:hypothetical protein